MASMASSGTKSTISGLFSLVYSGLSAFLSFGDLTSPLTIWVLHLAGDQGVLYLKRDGELDT